MLNHLRANLILLVATLALCCVLYPLALWALGHTLFHAQAEGSLVKDADGKIIGSHLIGQPFTSNEYFKPRPSNAGSGNGYDASASGASNWAASNVLLRDRVAQQLGPMVTYAADSPIRPGEKVGPDIDAWFQKQPGNYAAVWAKEHSLLAEAWVKSNTAIVAEFLGKPAEDVKKTPSDFALPFFEAYVKREEYKGTWPTIVDNKIKPVKEGDVVQAYFFDLWLSEHKDAKLKKVPADMVMSSGSGLDPHITLANALFQLDDVTAAWVEKTHAPEADVRKAIEQLLKDKKFAPMGGLFGVEMVNVLDVNLELRERMKPLAEKHKGKTE